VKSISFNVWLRGSRVCIVLYFNIIVLF